MSFAVSLNTHGDPMSLIFTDNGIFFTLKNPLQDGGLSLVSPTELKQVGS